MSTEFRDYLALEIALTRKLQQQWTKQAAGFYAKLTELVDAGDFAEAYRQAALIDLSGIGDDNLEYARAILRSCAVFGASMVNQTSSRFVEIGAHDTLLDQVLTVFSQSIEWNVTQQVVKAATQSIAQAEQEYNKVKKADKSRFLKDFVSFKKDGDEMLQLVSSLHTSRLSTWGFTAEAEVLGITKYKLSAVLDGRTSAFCRMINGKVFEVADARKKIVEVLSVQNPDDLRTVQPWPKQDEKNITELSKLSAKELTARGLHIPPFHPGCRTLLVPVSTAPRLSKPAVALQPLPEYLSDQKSFELLGLAVTETQVQHWNDYVKLAPIDVLSHLSGHTAAELADGVLGKKFKGISFQKDGDIQFKFKGKTDSGSFNGAMVFNPFSGVLYQSYAEFDKAKAADAIRFFRQLEKAKTEVGLSLGAQSVALMVGVGQASTFAALGYIPTADAWQNMRMSMLDRLKTDLAPDFEGLPETHQNMVISLLNSKDEHAFIALSSMHYALAEKLLQDLEYQAYLDLSNPALLQKHWDML